MSKLRVVKKTVNGVTVGFVVGWWTQVRSYRWGYDGRKDRKDGGVTFRSFRNGVVFKTKEKAVEFRDNVESKRVHYGVEWKEITG